MKKYLKIISIFILIFILISFLSTVLALEDIVDPNYYEPSSSGNADTIKNIGNSIIGVLQVVGSIVSVIVLIVIGIQYMLGSVEEKAQYKEKMWPYIVGAIMIFSVLNIIGIANAVAQSFL